VTRRSALLSTLLICLFAVGAAGQASASERATLPDIEDEVMCPVCGTLLELSESPQADRERAFIRTQIAQGRTKDQVKDALVAEYGRAVLATPDDNGFDLSAWLVPPLVLLLAGGWIAVAVVRQRRSGREAESSPVSIDPVENARIDRELADLD
jgi:cytochrome c-type biogenesis protein CcmH